MKLGFEIFEWKSAKNKKRVFSTIAWSNPIQLLRELINLSKTNIMIVDRVDDSTTYS